MDLGLKGAHVFITGASGGIGYETAKLFLEQGSNVTAHYNTQPGLVDALIAEFGRDRVQKAQADLAVETSVESVFKEEPTFGPVDIVVINHAIASTEDVPLAHMSLERWKKTIDVNLTGSFLVAKEYLRRLEKSPKDRRDRAAIVFVGSTAGKFGEANHADYAATKSAMMYGMTMSLKNEIVKIAPKGRVNCVAPGWVRTPMAEEALKNPDTVYRALGTTPLKKVATPRDIANQIVVLSSSTVSGHVSGQVVMVEGGMEGRVLNLPQDI